ncbi:LysM peptidoglycan-binding domain-containing protein [Streptomyces lavendulae]|uniref:CIS tube protein n=1 Tax=Streptomyces lavendulae TaxID=1914 RepID=UPI0033E2A771
MFSLAHAALLMFEAPTGGAAGPGAQIGKIKLKFNPEQLTLAKSAAFSRSTARAEPSASRPEFNGAQPRSLSLEIFLDSSLRSIFDIKPYSVQEQVDELMKCCNPTRRSIVADKPSPPWVRLEWGRASTACFNAYLTQVSAVYTLFDRDGTPSRATCSLTLEETGGAQKGQNPTSGSPGFQAEHHTELGESLASIAYREYGDPSYWRHLAAANNIDDPSRLEPGTVLIVPGVEDVWDETGGER